MRPIGREKSSYKVVKTARKALPVKGMIITVAALICAGWIFSVTTVDSASNGGNTAFAENAAADAGSIAAIDAPAAPGGNDAAGPGNTKEPNTGNAAQAGTVPTISDQTADAPDPAEAERIRAERQAKEKVWRERKETGDATYIGNANSFVFHFPHCSSVTDMNWENVVFFYGGRQELLDAGYRPCMRCNP